MFNDSDCLRILEEAMSTTADFAEVFQEVTESKSVSLLNGQVIRAATGFDSGTGIRLLAGTNSVYVYSSDNDIEVLLKLAREAAAAIKGQDKGRIEALKALCSTTKSTIEIDPMSVSKMEMVDFLRKSSDYALSYSPLITQAASAIACNKRTAKVINTRGVNSEDTTSRIRLSVEAIATKDNEKQSGRVAPGTMRGYEFINEYPLIDKTRECCDTAIRMVNAGYAPSAKMSVILGNGFGGVIFHEACGHALEATSVGIKNSYFTDKLGQQIASPIVSARDNALIDGEWGSYATDDEGNSSSDLLLIENGILKNYLVDELGARRMNCAPTGCSRRQNYSYAPTSRMSNTYICNGESDPKDIIANTEYGLYCTQMGGGSVDTSTGDFNFAVNEAFMVRDGKIAEPVRGATLIGKGQEILKNIDMVGNDLKLSAGMCGSMSGSVPVTVGQPTIRVSSILVGGRDS
ncbi:TldD/PmbA family protein [Butyrivibrio sp. AE2032]|uniref:TldD/PmbA family protein n=1 Tax=Butyrivibrio sp. AE2032 TaxID=1458463 RepID=UPI0005572804|nr:TldD/PmbA family protein [Butyrivibrio sp. AE2032]